MTQGVIARRPASPGQRFGALTAVERIDDYMKGSRREIRWLFRCECGRELRQKLTEVRRYVRRLGWAGCPVCYWARGGWEAIRASGGGS
jgi:hypothetical protein